MAEARDRLAPGGAETRLNLNVSSDPANLAGVRQQFEQFAAKCGFGQQAIEEIGLCLNEAMANVIRHAYGNATDRPVEVSGEFTDGALRIKLRDWGCGVNPAALAPAAPSPDRPGGLGLVCLRKLMDEVSFNPQPDGMLLTMVKYRR